MKATYKVNARLSLLVLLLMLGGLVAAACGGTPNTPSTGGGATATTALPSTGGATPTVAAPSGGQTVGPEATTAPAETTGPEATGAAGTAAPEGTAGPEMTPGMTAEPQETGAAETPGPQGNAPSSLTPLVSAPGAEQPGADPNATVTYAYDSGAQTYDPQVESFLNEIQVSSQVFQPLLGLNKDNKITPNSADSMDISPDGKTYTFKIHQGMMYSDGKPVTAANFAYAIKRACDPNVNGKYSSILYDITGCQEWREADVEKDKAKLPQLEKTVTDSITASDDQTLVIKLKQSAGYFPYVMSTWVTYPSREDLLKAGGASWWKDPKYYIGNGPFKMTSYDPKQGITFDRNDTYFRGKPGVAKLVFRVIDSPQTAFLAYQRGQVDIDGISSDQLPQVKGDLQQQLTRRPGACTFYLGFNGTKPPFDKLEVRQAFSAAINRDQFIKQVNSGVGKPTGSFLPQSLPGYQNQVQQTFDAQKAKDLLAKAGFKDGQGFPPQKYFYDSADERSKKRAVFFSQQFKQNLNVNIQPVPLDSNALQDLLNVKSKNPPIFLLGWCQDYPHPQDWLTLVMANNSPLAPAGWNDPEFNSLTAKADRLPVDKAASIYSQADKILNEKTPVTFVWYNEDLVMIKPNIKGIVNHLGDIEGWYYESEKIYKTK